MFRKIILVSVFIFILAFSIQSGRTSAFAASQNAGAVVTISFDQPNYTASQPVIAVVTISNPTSHPVKVLKWFTPAVDIEESLFNISFEGSQVSYLGPIFKRPAVTGKDYISLKPGAKLVRKVDLSAYYDFSASGNYSIRYDVASYQLHSEKSPLKSLERLASNEAQVWVEGRSSNDSQDNFVTSGVVGTTSYNKCTTAQQSTLVSARSQASTYSSGALAYLNTNTVNSRYTTWFGVFISNRYTTVTSHFSAISNAMDTKPVTFDCGCKKPYYAYVYPNKPYIIYLCKVFWTAPLTGTDSKAGTLIHEMSHFDLVAGTDDFVYGQAGAKDLAINNPDNAINNADNHEYFAENTPALP